MEIETAKMTGMIIGFIGLILLPLGGIWAINTLFLLGIEYTFVNWVAFAFLQLYLQVVLKASFIGVNTNKK
tara:strand:- start:539 stop:751 length:213 start_codon:yes stop_codon:yes gene_type:complete